MKTPRIALAFVLAAAAAAPIVAPPAQAGFGIFKTRLTLPRTRPPELPLRVESVAVELRAGGPEVEGDFLDLVRDRLERALAAGDLYRLEERPREADARVSVTLQRLRAEVRDELREEYKRVKVGERQEWNDKKKRYETKDVYADRRIPVSWRVAEGNLSGEVRVEGRDGSERRPLDVSYSHDFKKDDGVPLEARSEDELRRFMVSLAADQAVSVVAFGPDPVEALLATNGPLKAGNELLRDGRAEEALTSWSTLRLKGDDEAARRHNLGVAHEALAYRLPPFAPEHLERLEEARRHYEEARRLDPGEKYFAPPLERIETSLTYAADAAKLHADLTRLRDERRAAGARRAAPGKAETNAPPRREERAPRESIEARPAEGGLRNGSFEAPLPPWTVAGKAALVSEDDHGRVLELSAAPKAPASASQTLAAFYVPAGGAAPFELAYRVVKGDAVVRVQVAYQDEQGRERVSTLEVSNGEGEGGWSAWSHDLAALRPRPARVTGVSVTVTAGTVRLDDVTLAAQ
jgi:hypothetical protein